MRAALLARAAAAALASAALSAAAPARGADARPWYVPDHLKLQLAGNVGFLSPGAGWALGRRLDADVLVGWVPEAIGGADIWSVTGKVTFAPWSLERRGWAFRPLTAGLQVTYTPGDQYFVIPPFTFTPTAVRAGLALGTEASRAVGRRRVGLYAELVALDQALVYWFTNGRTIHATDVFSLALGGRLAF